VIVHRGGERIVQCDWCFSVCTSPAALRDEWVEVPQHGLEPARAAASSDPAGHLPAREFRQVAQPAHACPRCLGERGHPTGGARARATGLPSPRRDARPAGPGASGAPRGAHGSPMTTPPLMRAPWARAEGDPRAGAG
jgi:hypothetical protein